MGVVGGDPAAVAVTEALLAEMAEVAGMEEPPGCEVRRRNRGLASVRRADGDRAVVVIDRRLLGAELDVQRQVLGHELAHILRGHHLVRAASRPRFVVCLALSGLALVAAMAGLVSGPQSQWIDWSMLVTCSLFAGVMAIAGAVSRPREYDADRVACERFGVRFDEHLASWMSHHGCRGPGVLAVLSTHPSHRQRIRACRRIIGPPQ